MNRRLDEEVRASGWGEDEERNYSKYVTSEKIPSDEEEGTITSELSEEIDGEDFLRESILEDGTVMEGEMDDAASNSSIEKEEQQQNEYLKMQQYNNNSPHCNNEDKQELSVEEEEHSMCVSKSKSNKTRRGICLLSTPDDVVKRITFKFSCKINHCNLTYVWLLTNCRGISTTKGNESSIC